DYHLGDPLFLTGLAQDIARAQRPALLLHAGREAAATALEAQGVFDPDTVLGGPLGEHGAVVERALRDQNRTIAAALTEAGVAAVRLMASDRGLVRIDGDGADSQLRMGETDWVAGLLRQRSCVVVAALAETAAGPRLLHPSALAAALGPALHVPVVVLTVGRRPGLLLNGAVAETAGIAALGAGGEVPGAAVARAVVEAGGQAVVTSRGGAFDPTGAKGTRLV
ncbi:MAG: hypothetical protein AAGG50_20760, partial [Bacteroidota bacterium]